MFDYEKKMKKLEDRQKKLAEKKKENEEKIALKVGLKILDDFGKHVSYEQVAKILQKENPTKSDLIKYIISRYPYTSDSASSEAGKPSEKADAAITTNEKSISISNADFAQKYDAADVLQYADIDQIIQLGVLLSRAIGRPADMAHVEKYLLNSGAKIYIQKLGIQPSKPVQDNTNPFKQ